MLSSWPKTFPTSRAPCVNSWSHRLVVRTLASHAGNPGSNPGGTTKKIPGLSEPGQAVIHTLIVLWVTPQRAEKKRLTAIKKTALTELKRRPGKKFSAAPRSRKILVRTSACVLEKHRLYLPQDNREKT